MWAARNQNIISYSKQFYVVLWIYLAFFSVALLSKIKILYTILMALKRIDSCFYTLSIVEQNIGAIRFNFRLLFFSCHIQFKTFFCIDFPIQWTVFFFSIWFLVFFDANGTKLNKRRALSTLTHPHKTAEVEWNKKKSTHESNDFCDACRHPCNCLLMVVNGCSVESFGLWKISDNIGQR